jgi:ectoine hydroxylase-related dioxygenase (phytanoyl-CoA dioxygenase family)
MWSPVVRQLHTYISALFQSDDWDIHCVDCITTRPGSAKIRAHVDSPYRFDEYAMSKEILGVQIIIPLDPFTLENGATAFIPGSHLETNHYKDIEEFQEIFDDRIRNEGVQFLSQPGDVLMYDGKTLHSTMPNNADTFRSALLINALSTDVIEKANLLDKNTDRKKT